MSVPSLCIVEEAWGEAVHARAPTAAFYSGFRFKKKVGAQWQWFECEPLRNKPSWGSGGVTKFSLVFSTVCMLSPVIDPRSLAVPHPRSGSDSMVPFPKGVTIDAVAAECWTLAYGADSFGDDTLQAGEWGVCFGNR